ncbi:MAG: hypothetical protein OXG47_00550 [bacterium]|nr:hypothetical protein [bacterium]
MTTNPPIRIVPSTLSADFSRLGADVFVASSAVFGHPEGPAAAVAELRRLATAARGVEMCP